MLPRLAFAVVLTVTIGLADGGSSVNDLVTYLRAAMAKNESDSQITKYVQRVKLTQSLDETTIEQLESAGVGPKGVAALQHLRDTYRALPPPTEAVPGF